MKYLVRRHSLIQQSVHGLQAPEVSREENIGISNRLQIACLVLRSTCAQSPVNHIYEIIVTR